MPQPLTFLGRVPSRETIDDFEYRVAAFNAIVDPLCHGVSRQFFPFMRGDMVMYLNDGDTIIFGDPILGLSELTKEIMLQLVDDGNAVVYDANGVSILMFGDESPDVTLEKCGYGGKTAPPSPGVYQLIGHPELRAELLKDPLVMNVCDLAYPGGDLGREAIIEELYAEPRANYALFSCWPENVPRPEGAMLFGVPEWEVDAAGNKI